MVAPILKCLLLGVIPRGIVQDGPAHSDNGDLLRNVSRMAENVKIKVSWTPAECQGLHSSGASEERIFSLSSAKGETVGAGPYELLTFSSCSGAGVPQTIPVYICFEVNHYPTQTRSLFPVSLLELYSCAHPTNSS